MRAHAFSFLDNFLRLVGNLQMDSFLKLFDLIGELARQRYQIAEQNFSVLGLNHTEARLLNLLSQANGEATQDEISNMLFIDRSNAGRGLKRLEQKGFITKKDNISDKRTKVIQITIKGRQIVQKISKAKEKIARSLFKGLNEEDARLVLEIFQKLKK